MPYDHAVCRWPDFAGRRVERAVDSSACQCRSVTTGSEYENSRQQVWGCPATVTPTCWLPMAQEKKPAVRKPERLAERDEMLDQRQDLLDEGCLRCET